MTRSLEKSKAEVHWQHKSAPQAELPNPLPGSFPSCSQILWIPLLLPSLFPTALFICINHLSQYRVVLVPTCTFHCTFFLLVVLLYLLYSIFVCFCKFVSNHISKDITIVMTTNEESKSPFLRKLKLAQNLFFTTNRKFKCIHDNSIIIHSTAHGCSAQNCNH